MKKGSKGKKIENYLTERFMEQILDERPFSPMDTNLHPSRVISVVSKWFQWLVERGDFFWLEKFKGGLCI
jgi:hypothetical protein